MSDVTEALKGEVMREVDWWNTVTGRLALERAVGERVVVRIRLDYPARATMADPSRPKRPPETEVFEHLGRLLYIHRASRPSGRSLSLMFEGAYEPVSITQSANPMFDPTQTMSIRLL